MIKLAREPLGAGSQVDRDLLRDEGRRGWHPDENIVEVYDLDVHEGRPFLAMEWVRGCTLEQRAERARDAPQEAAVLVAALARVVEYLDAGGHAPGHQAEERHG